MEKLTVMEGILVPAMILKESQANSIRPAAAAMSTPLAAMSTLPAAMSTLPAEEQEPVDTVR